MPLGRLIARAGQPCALARARTDPDAFAAFYGSYATRVLVFFARRVFDAELALDLTSETFAEALQRREQFRGRLEQVARARVSRGLRALARQLAPHEATMRESA